MAHLEFAQYSNMDRMLRDALEHAAYDLADGTFNILDPDSNYEEEIHKRAQDELNRLLFIGRRFGGHDAFEDHCKLIDEYADTIRGFPTRSEFRSKGQDRYRPETWYDNMRDKFYKWQEEREGVGNER